ncbi:recombination regulator RecX [Lacticaseibacillus yichunensis]|uniref:Regulatory protein RecX n=1 Tax=Lacticaseibacillus yichunensis TaxID=2486015 RepID=A0ABW4CKL7_9LACO|nr:recombination regulator RecX [Lacticaseibacillus yichunensis]
MAEITQISAQKRKGRYNIFLDGKYAFPVSETTLIKFRLAKGLVVDAALESEIKAGEVEAMANTMALDYLNRQARTVKELRTHLRDQQMPEDVISHVVVRLTDLNYLDDAQYAQAFLHDALLIGDKGSHSVTRALREKGVAPEVIEDALADVAPADWHGALMRAATKAARQNQRRAFREQTGRIKLALTQKGFTQEQAAAALASLDLAKDDDHEADLLAREATKQWRLKQRYTGRDRTERVKQALFRKGFTGDAINEALAKLENGEELE